MCLILCIEDVEVIVGLDIVFFYKKKIKFCGCRHHGSITVVKFVVYMGFKMLKIRVRIELILKWKMDSFF